VTVKGTTQGDPAINPKPFTSQLMIGGWTVKGYISSPDRKHLFIHRFDGFAVSKDGGEPVEYKWAFNSRDVQWSPDSKRFLAWTSTGDLACFELDALGPGGTPRFTILRKAPPGKRPGGCEWGPDGNDAYFIELWDDPQGKVHGSLQRVGMQNGTATSVATVLSHSTGIRFYSPPVSRFQHGAGPIAAPYQIFVGAFDGCYLVNPNGKDFEQLTAGTADGVDNLEWSPDPKKEKILINFFMPTKGTAASELKGLYLVHLDRRAQGKKGEQLFEQLHDKLDVHTIWFSPHGKYATWVTWEGIYIREVEGKADTVKKIVIRDSDAKGQLEVRGCSWNEAETKLAVAASNRLFVYDIAKDQKWTVARCGKEDRTFAAEPVWRGDDVTFSTYTDMVPRRPAKK
jgi:hypothetical protein